MRFRFCFIAAQLFLATPKLWWCAVTARPCYASQPEDVLASPRAALSGKRVTEGFSSVCPLHNYDIRMVSFGDSRIEIGASFCFAYGIFVLLELLALRKF